MNKEEQEALEFIKKMEIETQIENVQIILNKENTKYFKIILELINKQQQELDNSISKDKIRTKIKELEEPDFSEYPIEKTIEILKKLLGDDEA